MSWPLPLAPDSPIFAEDHLHPITVVDGDLWFLSTLDGNLYCNAPFYSQPQVPGLRKPFIIPGDTRIIDMVREGTELVVTAHELDCALGSRRAVQRYPLRLPPDYSPTALISGYDGTRFAVLSSPDASAMHLIGLRGGVRLTIEGARGSIARGLLASGLLVEDPEGYAVLGGSVPRRGAGSVVSVYGDRFITRTDDKTNRDFQLVSHEGARELIARDEWEPIEAVITSLGITLTGVHPSRGYGIHHAGEWRDLDGTVQLFGLGDQGAVARQAGLQVGTWWRYQGRHRAGVGSVRSDIRVVAAGHRDLPVVHVSAQAARTLMVALHGGPDSHEWDDVRYGGSYRQLSDAGIDILILNYPGSRGFGEPLQQSAWQNWTDCIERCSKVVDDYRRRWRYERILLMGVSFGAWIAARLAPFVDAAGVVALSPILQLESHLRSHARMDPEFARWAGDRFGSDLRHARTGDDGVRRCDIPLIAIVPEHDEVVRPEDAFPSAPRPGWERVSVSGTHYPGTALDAAIRWAALVRAVLAVAQRA